MSQKQRYLDKIEQKKSIMLAAGLVSERFPGVSSIVFHMTYYQKTADPVLMKRTVNFFPTDYVFFHMDCMKEECVNGGFDLTPVVTSLVKNRKKTLKGTLACNGKIEQLRLVHARIDYEVTIQYSKPGK